jgi:hypothetical protein
MIIPLGLFYNVTFDFFQNSAFWPTEILQSNIFFLRLPVSFIKGPYRAVANSGRRSYGPQGKCLTVTSMAMDEIIVLCCKMPLQQGEDQDDQDRGQRDGERTMMIKIEDNAMGRGP